VECSRTDSPSACEHRIIAIDRVMDAALIEADLKKDDFEVARSTATVGFFEVSINRPRGRVDSRICEVEVPQGVIPIGAAGKGPSAAASLFCIEAGAPGWSGSLVNENDNGRPYCIFVGDRTLLTGRLGRLQMLRQIEMVWKAEILRSRLE
jgi:hypothetical protein